MKIYKFVFVGTLTLVLGMDSFCQEPHSYVDDFTGGTGVNVDINVGEIKLSKHTINELIPVSVEYKESCSGIWRADNYAGNINNTIDGITVTSRDERGQLQGDGILSIGRQMGGLGSWVRNEMSVTYNVNNPDLIDSLRLVIGGIWKHWYDDASPSPIVINPYIKYQVKCWYGSTLVKDTGIVEKWSGS